MADIAIERIPRSVRGRAFAKQTLRRALLALLACVFAAAGARFGYDWWTVGRFIETTDDAYVGGDVTPISPHVAGFVAEILVKDNDPGRATAHSPRRARFSRRVGSCERDHRPAAGDACEPRGARAVTAIRHRGGAGD